MPAWSSIGKARVKVQLFDHFYTTALADNSSDLDIMTTAMARRYRFKEEERSPTTPSSQVHLRLKNINTRHLFFLVDTLSSPLILGMYFLTDFEGYVDYDTFDCSVFTGEYVTGGVDAAYLAGLEQQRSDNAKLKAERSGAGPAMVSVNGKNTSDQVLASQPLDDVSGGGEVAGGGDVSQVVGLSNASEGHVQEKPSMIVGLGNEGM
ncbi:hypothetical protein JCM1840_004370 [Sporobolomyces johnsonii]